MTEIRRIYGFMDAPFFHPTHPTIPLVYSCFICECKWNFRLEILLNDFPHFWHTWGFSPVWISTWFLRFPFWWNPLPHTLQTKSFSSVCIFMWVFSVEERLNALLQCVHLCGLSAVWMILCRHSVDERRNPGGNVLFSMEDLRQKLQNIPWSDIMESYGMWDEKLQYFNFMGKYGIWHENCKIFIWDIQDKRHWQLKWEQYL